MPTSPYGQLFGVTRIRLSQGTRPHAQRPLSRTSGGAYSPRKDDVVSGRRLLCVCRFAWLALLGAILKSIRTAAGPAPSALYTSKHQSHTIMSGTVQSDDASIGPARHVFSTEKIFTQPRSLGDLTAPNATYRQKLARPRPYILSFSNDRMGDYTYKKRPESGLSLIGAARKPACAQLARRPSEGGTNQP